MDSFHRRISFLPAVLAAALALSLSPGLHAQATVPTLTQTLPAQTISATGAAVNLDLRNYFSLPGVTGQIAQFNTVLGTFNVELLASAAPQTVANFLTYVNSGTYTSTMIHRSASLNSDGVSNWIVQGGGYTFPVLANGPVAVPANAPIPLEYNLPNTAGTIAMARGSATNSATTQWFFNVDDNTSVLGPGNGGGYAVFGRVLGSGLTVVSAIAAEPTYDASGGTPGSAFTNLPLQNVTATQTGLQLSNIIFVNSVTVIPMYPTSTNLNAALIFNAANNNAAVVTAALSGSTLVLTPVGVGTATISVRAADVNNNIISGAFNVSVVSGASAPAIATQPASQTVTAGSTVVFSVAATGVPTPTYQWLKDGATISGATGATLVLNGASTLPGAYSVVVTNSLSSVTSSAASLAVTTTSDPGRLTNLSVLTDIAAGANFTVGTVVGGQGTSGNKALVVRAVGPSLGALGVPGTIPDPQLTLFNGSSVAVAANDNWGTPVGTGAASAATVLNAMASVGAFSFTSATSLDAAVYQPGLAPGNYSVQVSGTNGSAGTALAEIYDATPAGTFTASSPRLINVSVLKQINAGSTVTLGFTIGGSVAKTVLIRAIGPGLAAVGLAAGTLGDPQLTLFDHTSAAIATNDDWGADPQLIAVASRVNAFSVGTLPTKDSMLLVTLPPGGYTAQAKGNAGTSGLAIVEVYEVP